MGLRIHIRLFSAILLAASGSIIAYSLERENAVVYQEAYALEFAKQIVAQTESLLAYGKKKNEADPLGWAVRTLSAGGGPKLLELGVTSTGQPEAILSEKYKLMASVGTFSYQKILDHKTGDGIKMYLQLGYQGFLGAKSLGMEWTFLGILFGLQFAILFLFFGQFGKSRIHHKNKTRKFDETEHTQEPLVFAQAPGNSTSSPAHEIKLRPSQGDWVSTTRAHLREISLEIKTLLQESQALALFSTHTRDLLQEIRLESDKISQLANEFEKRTEHTNPLLDNPVALAPLKSISIQLKTCSEQQKTQLNAASKTHSDSIVAARHMGEAITRITASLLGSAGLIQKLKEGPTSVHPQKRDSVSRLSRK